MGDIIGAAVGVGFLVLWIYCIYDVVTTDESIVRHLPKLVWLLIVVLLGDIGSLLWLGLGRPRVWTKRVFENRQAPAPEPRRSGVSPLDDPSLDRLDPIVRHREEQTRLRLWEAQLKRREEELKDQFTDGTMS
jgi:hypothetical protein